MPDGNYIYTLTAQSTTTPKNFATDKVFGNITVARGSIIFTQFSVLPDSPQALQLEQHDHLASVLDQLRADPAVVGDDPGPKHGCFPRRFVRTVVSGAVRPAGLLQTDVWDGRNDAGNFPPSGFYLVRAVAEDVASVLSSGATAQLTIAYDPLRIYDLGDHAFTPRLRARRTLLPGLGDHEGRHQDL